MKNTLKSHQTFDSIKRICLSKKRIPFYSILLFLFLTLNLFFVPGFFSSGSEFFDANDVHIILIVFTLIDFFILISIMTPFSWLKKKNIESIDEDEPQLSVGVKIFSLWVPFCFYIIAQMLLLGICVILSPAFNISFIAILLTCVALCVLVFVWMIICACLYFAARSIHWYFIGFLTLNFAPIIISWGCYEIYNISSLVPHKSWNPLNFNLFVVLGSLLNLPVVFLLVSGGIIGAFMYLWRRGKNHPAINLTILSIVYKITVIFLVSLSGGFLLSKPFMPRDQISLKYVFVFLVVALLLSIVFGYFTFRKNRPISRIIITSLVVVVSCVLILGAIPSDVQREAYILPDKEDIESVELFLDSIEYFEVDKYFEDCIDLHIILLELFEDGYLPDETEYPYKEPECIADLWEDANFHYKLKDGKSFHREYRDLKDSAFDEFYIELLKSDMYTYSLQKIKPENPQMRYFGYGDDGGRWCELPESCVEELLKTYCDELKKADKSAFYEKYETIRFTGVYETGDRIIYIPLSFTNTCNLVKEYSNIYAAK